MTKLKIVHNIPDIKYISDGSPYEAPMIANEIELTLVWSSRHNIHATRCRRGPDVWLYRHTSTHSTMCSLHMRRRQLPTEDSSTPSASQNLAFINQISIGDINYRHFMFYFFNHISNSDSMKSKIETASVSTYQYRLDRSTRTYMSPSPMKARQETHRKHSGWYLCSPATYHRNT